MWWQGLVVLPRSILFLLIVFEQLYCYYQCVRCGPPLVHLGVVFMAFAYIRRFLTLVPKRRLRLWARTTSAEGWLRSGGILAWLGAVVLLVPGLLAPSFSIIPRTGYTWLDGGLFVFRPELIFPKTFSILGAVNILWSHHERGLATVIFAFSVVFPLTKLLLLGILLATLTRKRHIHSARMLRVSRRSRFAASMLHHFGSWSMLDVFVIAVLVAGFKDFPGGTELVREWGLYCFALSVILSMIASVTLVLLHNSVRRRNPTDV